MTSKQNNMKDAALFFAGIVLFLVPGGWAFIRARRELLDRPTVTRGTSFAALAGYSCLAGVVLLASWTAAWRLPLGEVASAAAGTSFALIGGCLYLAGRLQFASFRRTWGLESNRLITTGTYRFIRHPQNLGWGFLLGGIALLGSSGVALALAAVYVVTCIIWLPVEEAALDRRFGSQYRAYRARTSALIPLRKASTRVKTTTETDP